jgi:hypothetical protein
MSKPEDPARPAVSAPSAAPTAPVRPPPGSRAFRWTLAALCLVAALAGAVAFFDALRGIPDPRAKGGIELIAHKEQVTKALDMVLGSAENLRQFGLLLLGALWALLIAKRDEHHISPADLPELLMLLSAHVLIGLSFYAQWRHEQTIHDFLHLSASFGDLLPDYRDPRVAVLLTLQFQALAGGAAAAVVTLLSAARLK